MDKPLKLALLVDSKQMDNIILIVILLVAPL